MAMRFNLRDLSPENQQKLLNLYTPAFFLTHFTKERMEDHLAHPESWPWPDELRERMQAALDEIKRREEERTWRFRVVEGRRIRRGVKDYQKGTDYEGTSTKRWVFIEGDVTDEVAWAIADEWGMTRWEDYGGPGQGFVRAGRLTRQGRHVLVTQYGGLDI